MPGRVTKSESLQRRPVASTGQAASPSLARRRRTKRAVAALVLQLPDVDHDDEDPRAGSRGERLCLLEAVAHPPARIIAASCGMTTKMVATARPAASLSGRKSVDLQLLEAVTGRIVLQMTVSKSRRFEKALQLVGLVHGACDVSVVQAFPHSRTMAMQQSISLCPPQSVHHSSRISRSAVQTSECTCGAWA